MAPQDESGSPGGRLFNLVKERGYCDLLLDRELADPLAPALAERPIQEPLLPINPLKARLPPDRCLMLARLRLAELPTLDDSLEIASRQCTQAGDPIRSIGGWLFSRDVPAQKMARHLEQAIVVRVDNAPDVLLRLWDPRVLPHLPRILTPEQLAAAFGRIECWAWMDRSGQLQVLQRPSAASIARLPLRLSAEQDSAIDRIELINALLKTLGGLGHTVDPSRDRELDEVVLLAQRKGHTKEPDMLSFGLHALLISRTFDLLPEVRHAIQAAQAQGLGLREALSGFDDSFWAANVPKVAQASHEAATAPMNPMKAAAHGQ